MSAISRPQCLEGTRVTILQSLMDSLVSPSSETNVVWLSGMAGSGKSTIATTVAERLHARGQRGAFLFFNRNSPAQSGPDGVIRTLAHQLALSNDVLRKAICDVIERDPQIATTTLTSQFNNLIMTPLHSCASKITGPIVIILDAFDECGEAQSRRALLHLFVKHLPTIPRQFRFLITGRPELDLNNVFCSQLGMVWVSLSAAEWSSATDVLRYIEHKIDELYQTRRGSDELPVGWPGKPKVQDIGAQAADSFIWAATAIRFLYAADDVDEHLEMLLGQAAFTLSDLYATTLLGCLLQWSEGVPIRTLHASFTDYLTDTSSCGGQPWFVNRAKDHVEFTTGCLRVMKRFLRFNICQLETSHLKNCEVPDLAKRIEDCIPRSLAYACRFWAEHLSLARTDDLHLTPLILDFFHTLFVYWLEVLSLIGEARVALQAMLYLKAFNKCDIHVQAFTQDGIKFTRAFMSVILESAPHIYVSALPFAPSTSIIKQQYSRIMGNTLHIPTSTTSGWPSCEQAIEGCDSVVSSVVYSPDGDRVASGSNDGKVRVWNTHTGELAAGPFEGHIDDVISIAFSPDGVCIVSGSEDCNIRVWDVHTGELVEGPFEHTQRVLSVAFLPGGEHIASGSSNTTVHVWNAQGELVGWPFKGHTGVVTSLLFSPNKKLIVSGSLDGTIHIWDACTGDLVAGPFEGHEDHVFVVAFSPDGKHIASGSEDKCIRVWGVRSGELVAGPFKGHSSMISSVAFSPDGKHIASGSYDHTTGKLVSGPFEGHSNFVTSVAYSPDGLHIVSGSEDHTIRFWDARIGELLAGPDELHIALGSQDNTVCHSNAVTSVVFSPDGLHIASGSDDAAIHVWDANTGRLVAGPLEGHTDSVNSVAFSPDGLHIVSGSEDHTITAGPFLGHIGEVTSVAFSPNGEHIASGSMDNTVCIRDAYMGGLLTRPLEGHTGAVSSVAFSPNARLIVSGSWNGTICMWDAGTGRLLAGPLRGQTAPVRSIAFSPDGVHIASGSYDCTTLVAGPLGGHTQCVNSVAFSPGGECIASGSDDTTGHADSVTSVAFSPSGTLISSGSRDGTIRIWDACTGVTVKGPSNMDMDGIHSVTFSPNGLGVTSGGAAIHISDLQTSSFVAVPFEWHTGPVNSVAFSPNGEHIVSGSADKTIHIFDMPTDANSSSVQGFRCSSHLVNGWMQNSSTELLFWVPPAYRTGLWRPNSTVVISQQST
ncbi:WD40 repeat-like protein [Athelia psychrophila]|uniref:WD40 repeat-like protein n=1 Tax=Athelia psychrophila TaxID=1759441 RepID=A0A166R8U8_9AGAM|nr:WD40 repeat-like protein [Fibularhizoctonia sp. CBS 109695]